MGMPDEPYYTLIVETYYESGSGLHGDIHVRCVEGQEFPPSFRVRASRRDAPLGFMRTASPFSIPITLGLTRFLKD
jgi:hypothetical protein